MPHNTQAWLTDQGGQQVLYVEESLTANEVAQLLEVAAKASSGWHDTAEHNRR
ncbi:hypothetical protein [Streptomyces sp. NPDC004330]|uniref:hypothetical protein n=1 Tax=Streptomyces sp. NPDC004330 TaxID=3364700 RepID=UPI00368C140C